MIGLDTLVLTRKGFKTVAELKLFDEVLTGYGVFEPIIKLGPIKKMEKCVVLNTMETIYCSDNLMWNVTPFMGGINADYRTIKFTDEEDVLDYAACGIIEHGYISKKPLMPAYEYSVVVPMCVPYEYLLSSNQVRSEFMAGLIDSPICEVTHEGIYNFYTQYPDLARGIISLARTFGWGVSMKHSYAANAFVIRVVMDNNFNFDLIRDNYKRSCALAKHGAYVRMSSVTNLSNNDKNNHFGREVCVNGGMLLIGYSMFPVQ